MPTLSFLWGKPVYSKRGNYPAALTAVEFDSFGLPAMVAAAEEIDKVRHRKWLGEQPALRKLHVMSTQEARLDLGLDTFGDNLKVKSSLPCR